VHVELDEVVTNEIPHLVPSHGWRQCSWNARNTLRSTTFAIQEHSSRVINHKEGIHKSPPLFYSISREIVLFFYETAPLLTAAMINGTYFTCASVSGSDRVEFGMADAWIVAEWWRSYSSYFVGQCLAVAVA
jgi:hypothetical protein